MLENGDKSEVNKPLSYKPSIVQTGVEDEIFSVWLLPLALVWCGKMGGGVSICGLNIL